MNRMRKWILFLLFFVSLDNLCIAKRLNTFPEFLNQPARILADLQEGVPPLKRGVLSSIFPNFKSFIPLIFWVGFCKKSKDLYGFSPPLAGGGGWKSTELAKFHPLAPASGGNSPYKPKTLGKNFNISPLVKQNLTALPFKGGIAPCKLKTLGINFSLSAIKVNLLSLVKQDLSPPPSGGKGEENIYSTIKDSTFQLVKKIPIQSTYLTTDNLQNLYVATEEGQIIKFDKNGNRQFEYNNNRLGKVGKIDVRNPLTILVYYPELEVIILLDRTLSEIKELNLYELDIFEPKVVALANDNNIWVYDEVAAILKKINQEGATLFESRNLNQLTQKQLNPAFLQEYDNQLFLSDVDNGLFIFDAFGQLKHTLPNKGITRFQVFDNQLFFQRNEEEFLLEIDLLKEKKMLLPLSNKPTKDIYINSNLVYLITEETVEIYTQK